MEKVKVLLFVDRMRTGGIQILLVNLLKVFDKKKYSFDVLMLDDGTDYPMEKDIIEAGASIYKLKGIWINTPIDYIKYKKAVSAFFNEHHDYDVVHMHSSSKNFLILKYAKEYGVSIRIAHSHNTDFQTHNRLKIIIGDALKKQLIKYSTDCLACSKIAGEWLFWEKMVEDGRVLVIKNGIDIEKYQYNQKVRDDKREELGISDKLVIGNIGRFVRQKNHDFLIDIFSEIKKIEPNSILILAGIGELMNSIKEKVKGLGLESDVLFLGFRSDVNELTQAMDLFLMPSFYEGFPVTAVEAQAAGLPCVLSSSITDEASILDETVYVDLNQSAAYWAEQALKCIGKSDRKNSYETLKSKGFDITDMAKSLENIYARED